MSTIKNNMARQVYNRLSLVGQKFGRLTVLKDIGNHPTRGESYWKCRCDCGKIVNATGNWLTSGNTKSCGCYHRDHCRQLFSIPLDELKVSKVLADYRKCARNRNQEFKLNRNEVKKLIESNCYYCGSEPKNTLIQHGRKIKYQGIDRLDNSLGYIPTNVVPCCIVCNKMKKVLNYNEFIDHIERIHELHKKGFSSAVKIS